MSKLKFYYVDGNQVDGSAEWPLSAGTTLSTLETMTAILAPDRTKRYRNIMTNTGVPIDADPIVIAPDVKWLVFYTDSAAEDPVEVVLTHLRPPPPPPTLHTELNAALSHELINTRNTEEFAAWGAWVARQRALASWLSIPKEWPQGWEDLRADFDWDALMDPGFRWEMSESMWRTLHDAIKAEWAKPRTWAAFSNQMQAFFVLANEWSGYFRTHSDDATRGRPGYANYVSLLRFNGHPAKPILMAITAEYEETRHPTYYTQVHISVSPAAWIYRVTHGNPAVIKGVSMVLHSVTAHAMMELYPAALKSMHIAQPFETMRTIVLEAAKKERFTCKTEGRDLIIPLRDNPNFTELWRRQAVAQMQCALCGLAPVRVTCGACERTAYCGDECADHDWREHAHHKTCAL